MRFEELCPHVQNSEEGVILVGLRGASGFTVPGMLPLFLTPATVPTLVGLGYFSMMQSTLHVLQRCSPISPSMYSPPLIKPCLAGSLMARQV